VTTQAATSVAPSGATLNGTVTADGGGSLTDRGFYWKTSSGVTTADNQLSEGGTSVAAFSKALTGLSPNTNFFYRSYAVNSAGTGLGSSDVSFYTPANTPSAPTVNGATPNSLNVAITLGDGNPAYTTYAIQETTSGNYVQGSGSAGTLGATAVYRTASSWGTTIVNGLNPGTAYTFAVIATNIVGTPTSLSSTTGGTTQTTPLAGWYGPWSGVAASPLNAPTIDANLSSAQLARSGLTGSSTTARYSSSGWNTTANYMTATLTAASGYVINLNSAALTGNWGSSSTGPGSFDVRSSVDNYASSLGTINSSTATAYTSLTLPASGYNGLSTITFRFIGSATAAGGGSTAGGGTGGSANLYVSGSIVSKAASSVSLVSSVNPSLPAASVDFAATVSGGVGTPTGTILFKTNSVALGSAATLAADGKATNSTASLAHGTNVVTAEYSGDANYLPSTNSLFQIVNAPPVAPNQTLGAPAGGAASLLIIGGKYAPTDPDGDALTVSAVTQGANGTVSFTSTNVTYTSTSAASSDSFTYTVSDGLGGTATGTVSVTLTSGGGTFNQLSVTPIEGGALQFLYLGIPGTNYALEVTHSLSGEVTWSPVQTNPASGTGSLVFTNMPSLMPTNDFYRTRYVP